VLQSEKLKLQQDLGMVAEEMQLFSIVREQSKPK
jgi:hypothetical protein